MAASHIDEHLYSRQLYVFGHEAQRRMASSDVLLCGLNGLGVEVAKNIILAGTKSVTLWDNAKVTLSDLGTQFFLSEQDVGKPRAAASLGKLAELNPYVHVSLLEGEFRMGTLARFHVVVLIGQSFALQLEVSDFCHQQNIAFISGDTAGVFGTIFCDFGRNFVISDANGEAPANAMIASITRDFPCLVTVLEETRHGLESGDVVVISGVAGMEELNGNEYRVNVKDPYSFEIDVNSSNFSPYEHGGYINQIKQPTTVSFDSLRSSLAAPKIVMDEMKSFRGELLHALWGTFHAFIDRNGCTPRPGSVEDADAFYHLLVTRNEEGQASNGEKFFIEPSSIRENEGFIKRFALCSRGQVSPVCALVGGVLGQEVLKACSGKFMPIRQWYYYEAIDALSDAPLPEEEVTPRGTRYDGQIMVFGRTLQEKLAKLNLFLVGAGAIGCEMLKNWAMMGVAAGDGVGKHSGGAGGAGGVGVVHVTDMDQIERSNLSRQFLFRNTDIGQLKSVTAVRSVTAMNPAFNGKAYESKVAPETEAFFNDDFFESLHAVCAALDNVEARLYLDQRCLFYHVSLLESGTLGTKGHTQVVVPGMTEHYGAARDPPEKSIPLCTLKSFPNQIEHTLQWAREWFEEAFKQTADDVNNYLMAPDFNEVLASQQNNKIEVARRLQKALTTERPTCFDDCVAWARIQFEELFVNRIEQLLYNLPLDKVTETGALFWSGAKKPPAVIPFDPADELHYEFVVSVARMRAHVFGLPAPEHLHPGHLGDTNNVVDIARICASISLPVFRPAVTTVALTDEEEKGNAVAAQNMFDVDNQCSAIINSIPSVTSLGGNFKLHVVDFDKDHDSHMRVVAAAANLRARNYRIPEADLHKARGIAGKIMPAIATTTALVTGLVCMELYKVVQGKPVDKYLNTFSNLALPLFTSMEPQPPTFTTTTVKGEEWRWSQWDRIDISEPSMTLVQLIEMVENKYGAELSMLSSGVSILYSNFMNPKKVQERKNLTLKQIVELVTKREVPATQKYLIFELIMTDAETDEELEIPYLRFRLQ